VRLYPTLLVGLVSCSEYGLGAERKGAEAGGEPEVAASPESVERSGLCDVEEVEVTISNEGTAALEISGLAIDGDGWTVATAPALPLTLGAGESTLVTVATTGGVAELVVTSNDADEPELRVPLSAEMNQPPTVSITSPTTGTVWAEGEDAELVGIVDDDTDPPETLAVTWESSLDGVLSTDAAQSNGSTLVSWPASGRTTGTHTVTLTATDSCWESGSATVDVCQDGAVTYDALALSSWHYEGAANYDSTNGWLQLTPATADTVGTAFELSSPFDADYVDIEFLFYIGGGTGADGISLTALDTSRASTFLGGTGCGIGYGGDASCTAGPALPGWSIEVDTYQNSEAGDPAADHVAFTFDGDVDGPEVVVDLPEMEDTGWHTMHVTVLEPRVTVTIDGTTWIDGDYPGNYAFTAYVGFTAGTGSLTNEHLIDDLEVTDYTCD
jgi:hypothetical protein